MDRFVIKTPRSFNNLDNDPEKRNSQCLENQISKVHRHASETPQSDKELSSDLVSTTKSSGQRKFLPKWRETYQWVTYNEIKSKAFCSVCSKAYDELKIPLPQSGSNDDKVYQAFVKDGFDIWTNAIARFKSHEKTQVHRKASSSIMSVQTTSITKIISTQCQQDRRDARSCLLTIFETIRFLAVQNVPIRGHTEIGSNFIQLLYLRSKDNALLKAWMERSTYRWVSHDIINEILSIMSLDIQKKLLSEIRRAPFFAVMADETTDVSRKEQMSVNIRVVGDDMIIEEYFLGFYDTPKTDSETLFAVLNDALVRFELQIKNCRGQCYDGASNVSGEITGLQTRFRGVEPRAIYTHCAGHNLNLVAQDGMKVIPEIADFLSNMKNFVTFCRASAKRNNIFKNITFDEEEDDENDNCEEKVDDKIGSLKPFCPTRWTVRVKSLKSIRDNYKRNLKLCEIVGSESTDTAIKARGFASYLQKFECYILLEICIATLEPIEELNATIQATTITFSSTIRRVDILKSSMNALRSDEKFQYIWTSATDSAKSFGLEDPFLPRQRVAPKRYDKNSSTAFFPKTPEEKYRIMYFGVIDQILSSLNTRFDSESYKILSTMEDFATQKCGISQIEPFLLHNGECDFDIDRLVLHRQMFFDHIKNQKVILDNLTKISIYLQDNEDVKDFCNEYAKFIKLLLTAPQSVCIAERSFSSLKLLKTYVRSNTTQKKPTT